MTNSLPPFAHLWLEQRTLAAARLDQLRLDELHQMTETDAARIFAQLDPLDTFPLRPSSGLLEQQFWFRSLRDKGAKKPIGGVGP